MAEGQWQREGEDEGIASEPAVSGRRCRWAVGGGAVKGSRTEKCGVR